MGPHDTQPVLRAGQSLDTAGAACILVHGRGADPRDMAGLAQAFRRPGFAYLMPAAAGNTWYPFSFLSPRAQNQPGIDSGLAVIDGLVKQCLERGIPENRIVVGGFSQGACLASEFCVRHPRKYGALLAFSGGLIGPPGSRWDDVTADLAGMEAFLGCSDVDPHIPKERVIETEQVLARLGASVVRKLYPGMGHTINEDELKEAQRVLDGVLRSSTATEQRSRTS
jgi:glyoxalase family protein